MRMKYFFLSMLALASLASCGNDEQATPDADGVKFVTLSVNYSAPTNTRAIETPHTDTKPTLSDVYVEWSDATKVLSTVGLSADDVAILNAAGTPSANVISKTVTLTAPEAATKLRLVANNGTTTVVSNAIKNYQGKVVTTAIPYEGEGAISGDAENGYTATVALNVAVARVEVSGAINAFGKGWKVEILGVYANNFLQTKGGSDVFVLAADASQNITGTLVDGMHNASGDTDWGTAFKTQAAAGDDLTTTKCAGYQFFAGANYGLALKVKATKISDSSETTGFIVIKSFNADGAKVAALTAGTIYQLNLTDSGIEDSFVGDVSPITPDPSGQDKQVAVTVGIMQWSAKVVTPNI